MTLDALYQQGTESYEAGNYSQALELWETAAHQGHADAQYACSVMHSQGQGTLIDHEKALYWCQRAADQGHESALADRMVHKLVEMGLEYAEIRERNRILDRYAASVEKHRLTEEDIPDARGWFEQAAKQGDAQAQFACGFLYGCGFRFYRECDLEKALYWLEKAADQGHARAQLYCGRICYFRLGDEEQARCWLDKAIRHAEDKETRMEAAEILVVDMPYGQK